MEILEIVCFDKRHEWQGSIEVIGKQKADELIAYILSQSLSIAYCAIETKRSADERI